MQLQQVRKELNDYSTWKSTYSDKKDLISSGDTNNITAMLSCSKNQNTTSNHMTAINSSKQLSAYANVNIIGINEAPIAVAKIDDKKVNEGQKVILNGAGARILIETRSRICGNKQVASLII